jgi:NADPH:quinone reductase-like Zn-dependent oxidoreductase
MLEEGLFNQKLKLPRTPCSDGACKAAAVGEGVSGRLDGRKVRLPPPGLFAAAGET